jgi:hypothetical protein
MWNDVNVIAEKSYSHSLDQTMGEMSAPYDWI